MNVHRIGPSPPAAALLATLVVAAASIGFAPAQAARDPMRPPQQASGRAAVRAVPEPALTAVIGTAERRVAVVNGRVVREGDSIDGVRVVAVFEDGIRYVRGGTTRELRLPRAVAVKRPARASAATGSGR